MVGLPLPGWQYDHVNHTNYTHPREGRWRGWGYVPHISWVLASTLYNGFKLVEAGAFSW